MAETPDIELASTSPLNRVPVEIWVSILSHLADLHHLWTACRSVSRGFRGFVEQLFAQHHIQHTFVELDLGELNNKRTWAISVTGYGYVPGKAGAPRDLVDRLIPLSFDHFSPDRKLACFKDYRPQECFVSEDTWVDAVNLWKSELPAQVRASDLPPHIVQVRSYLCDYHLPDIMTDAENRLVSFDWRALFTSFFREIGMLKRWDDLDTKIPKLPGGNLFPANPIYEVNTSGLRVKCALLAERLPAESASVYLDQSAAEYARLGSYIGYVARRRREAELDYRQTPEPISPASTPDPESESNTDTEPKVYFDIRSFHNDGEDYSSDWVGSDY